ncbi:cytochrome P450 [Aspergillus insuetus]
MSTVLDDFRLIQSNNSAEIHAPFDHLRSQCPVVYTSENDGFWQLTRYEDIKGSTSDSGLHIFSVKEVIPSDPRGIRRPLLNTESPAHTPYRTALDRTLKPARIQRFEPVLTSHAQRKLSKFVSCGGGDVCADFAAPLAAWVKVSLLNLSDGLAPEPATTASKWRNAWRDQNGPETTTQSRKMYTMAEDLLQDRRASPQDPEQDPASSLLLEKDADSQPLSDDLLIGCLCQSLVVGMVAPPILIGSMCNHLARDKALQQELRAKQSLIPSAAEEFVCLYAPYCGFCRSPSRPIEIRGRVIQPTEPISMTYAASNRYPVVRARALQIASRVILQATSDFEVVGPLQYAKMPEMGITSCPLKVTSTR